MRAGDDATRPEPPDDVGAMRALLLQLWRERDEAIAERDALATQNDRLRHLLAKLQRTQFGRKSERLPDEQLQFAFEEIAAAIAANEAEAEKRSPKLRDQRAARRRGGARAAAGCRLTCRASSRCSSPRTPPAPAAAVRWR